MEPLHVSFAPMAISAQIETLELQCPLLATPVKFQQPVIKTVELVQLEATALVAAKPSPAVPALGPLPAPALAQSAKTINFAPQPPLPALAQPPRSDTSEPSAARILTMVNSS